MKVAKASEPALHLEQDVIGTTDTPEEEEEEELELEVKTTLPVEEEEYEDELIITGKGISEQ